VAVPITIAFGLAACGGAAAPSKPPDPFHPLTTSTTSSTDNTSPSTNPQGVSSGNYTNIGTETVSLDPGSGGGQAVLSYSIGSPVVAANPPKAAAQVFSACDMQTATLTGQSVFVPGSLTITFQGGPYASQVHVNGGDIGSLANESLVGGANLADGVLAEAVAVNGQWSCGDSTGGLVNGSSGFEATISPGQSVTYPIWVIAENALNNGTPTFSQTANPDWAFTGNTVTGGLPDAISASGPHAFVCSTDPNAQQEVSLFASPPFTMTPTRGQPLSCTAPPGAGGASSGTAPTGPAPQISRHGA
jgi:hypothetical protein